MTTPEQDAQQDAQQGLSRRKVVSAAGAVALGAFGACALAACGGSSSASTGATTGDATTTDAAASTTTDAATTADAASAALTPLSAVPVGGALIVNDASGKPVVISQPSKKKVVGFSAVCPHAGGIVGVDGADLVCPLHGSKFNALTGAVTTGPATSNLAAFAVKLDGTNVVAG